MLTAIVIKREFEYSKVNIDMSSAFNTIRRQTTVELLEKAGCPRNGIRLVQYLLSNTKLRVCVNRTVSDEFEFNIGACQGDSLSGKLFTLNLAGALRHIRITTTCIPRPNPPISNMGIPLESEYADDVEYLDENMDVVEKMMEVVPSILENWSLFVNESKTAYTRVYLAETKERDEHNNLLRGNEQWRETIVLGSKLCSERDIQHRLNKANIAFHTYKKIWLNGTVKIDEKRKIRLYDALITSVLLYNSSSWAVPDNILNKLDVQQRKHLKQILKIFWPRIISNSALYKRCNVIPLTRRIEVARWRMLGHVLRSGEYTPAFLSFRFACLGSKQLKGRLGRPRSNLYDLVTKDLKTRSLCIEDERSFRYVVMKAYNRKLWQQLE